MQSHYLFFLMFTSSQDNVLLFCGRDYVLVGLTWSSKFESGQFYWWRKPEYLEKTADLSQVTDKVYQIMLKYKDNIHF
jgi:hypothetical protein